MSQYPKEQSAGKRPRSRRPKPDKSGTRSFFVVIFGPQSSAAGKKAAELAKKLEAAGDAAAMAEYEEIQLRALRRLSGEGADGPDVLSDFFSAELGREVKIGRAKTCLTPWNGNTCPSLWIPMEGVPGSNGKPVSSDFNDASQRDLLAMLGKGLGAEWMQGFGIQAGKPLDLSREVAHPQGKWRDHTYLDIYEKRHGWCVAMAGWPYSEHDSPFYATPTFLLHLRRLVPERHTMTPVLRDGDAGQNWVRPNGQLNFLLEVSAGDVLEFDSLSLFREGHTEISLFDLILRTSTGRKLVQAHNQGGDLTIKLLAARQEKLKLTIGPHYRNGSGARG